MKHEREVEVADPREKVVVVDVSALTRPDLATIDVLARLVLGARRAGCRLQLRNAGRALQELIALTGLDEVSGLGVDLGRQIEERVQLRLEEVRDVGDQPA